MLLFSPERYLILGHIWIYCCFLEQLFLYGFRGGSSIFQGYDLWQKWQKSLFDHLIILICEKMSSFYEKMCKQWNNAVFVSFCEMNFFQAINQNRVPTRQRRDYFLNGWKVKTVTVWTDDCEDECDCSRASRNFLVPSSTTKPYFTSYVWIDMTDTN